jgi:hypothetical protein
MKKTATVAVVASIGVFAAPAMADVTQVGGGAFGERVDVTRSGLPPTQSGPLPVVTLPPGGGGPFTNSVASSAAPADGSILRTGVLQVITEGALGPAGFAASSASADNVNAFDGRITATAADGQCRSEAESQSAGTTIVGGQLDGQALPTTPPPNTVMNSPGLQLILNEQEAVAQPGESSITVNAMHIRVLPPLGDGDVIISQSRCRVAGPGVGEPGDTAPPETFIDSGPSGTTNDPTPTFAFHSSEEGSTFGCRVDGGAWQPCNSPHTTAELSDGRHTFEVRATDEAGNTDPTPAARTFTVRQCRLLRVQLGELVICV